jgi:hypothetical protein
MKNVVFISGPYRGDVQSNIQKAKDVSIKLWQQGYIVICPHLNTANFDGLCSDQVWLDGDMEIMRRCDIVYFLKAWRESAGALKEYSEAVKLNKILMFE